MKRITKLVLALALAVAGTGGASAVQPQDGIGSKLAEVDFTTMASYAMWKADDANVTISGGWLKVVNETATDFWKIQYFVADGVTTTKGNDYVIRATIKGSAAGSLTCAMGDWSNSVNGKMNFTTDWQEVDLRLREVPATSSHVVFQSGDFVGTIEVKKIEIYNYDKEERMTGDKIHECDYSTKDSYPWYSMYKIGDVSQEKVVGGVLTIANETSQDNWKVQYFVDDKVPTVVGGEYIIRTTIKGSAAGSVTCNVGDWSNTASTTIAFDTDWQTVDAKVVGVPSTSSFVVFQSGAFVGTIEVKKVEVYEIIAGRTITVSAAEYTTFSADKAVKMDGVTAYAAKYEGGTVTLTEVTEVPAEAAVIVKAGEGSYQVPVIESAEALTDNQLKVSDGTVTGDGTVFVLANGTKGVGFYKLKSGSKVPAGKAYLSISGGGAPEFVGFGNGETTGIETIGQLDNLQSDNWYDLQGRQIEKSSNRPMPRGLYIVGGKKVIVK